MIDLYDYRFWSYLLGHLRSLRDECLQVKVLALAHPLEDHVEGSVRVIFIKLLNDALSIAQDSSDDHVQREEWRLREHRVEESLHLSELREHMRIPSEQPRERESRNVPYLRDDKVDFLVLTLEDLHQELERRDYPRLKVLEKVVPNEEAGRCFRAVEAEVLSQRQEEDRHEVVEALEVVERT